jgi:hypothetical protein
MVKKSQANEEKNPSKLLEKQKIVPMIQGSKIQPAPVLTQQLLENQIQGNKAGQSSYQMY